MNNHVLTLAQMAQQVLGCDISEANALHFEGVMAGVARDHKSFVETFVTRRVLTEREYVLQHASECLVLTRVLQKYSHQHLHYRSHVTMQQRVSVYDSAERNDDVGTPQFRFIIVKGTDDPTTPFQQRKLIHGEWCWNVLEALRNALFWGIEPLPLLIKIGDGDEGWRLVDFQRAMPEMGWKRCSDDPADTFIEIGNNIRGKQFALNIAVATRESMTDWLDLEQREAAGKDGRPRYLAAVQRSALARALGVLPEYVRTGVEVTNE